MKRYKVIRDGKETNSWTEDYAGADYYEPGFGLPERIVEVDSEPYTEDDILESIPAVMDGDEQLEPPKVRLRAQYTIEIEDISAEVQAQAVMQAIQKARAFGDTLINKMSYRNALKPGWDVEKTLAYIAQTDSIMKLLQAGALESALSQIQGLNPSVEVPQEDLDFAIAELQAYLGL
jgi:hypothetical protein